MTKKEACSCGSMIEKDRQALGLDRCLKCAEADPNDPVQNRPLARPVISLSRQSKTWAIFDDFHLRRDFTPYDDELDAIQGALAWIGKRNPGTPELVLPVVKVFKASS